MNILKGSFDTLQDNSVESQVNQNTFLKKIHQCRFPAESLIKPLESVEFCGIQMDAPRGGLEIQKYFFKEWNVEKKPKGCKNLGT